MNFALLMDRIREQEGFRAELYPDSGGWAIGYGRNLTFRPLTKDEAEYLLLSDLRSITVELQQKIDCWFDLNSVRQEVLAEMAYNLGTGGLLQFKRMLSAMRREQWNEAENELLDSKAARQLPRRYGQLAQMMRTGERA